MGGIGFPPKWEGSGPLISRYVAFRSPLAANERQGDVDTA